MTEADLDAIGLNGTVRLRCYLASTNTVWFLAGYEGLAGCGHVAPIGVRAAIRLMGLWATVGELERRLWCSRCNNHKWSHLIEDIRAYVLWRAGAPCIRPTKEASGRDRSGLLRPGTSP